MKLNYNSLIQYSLYALTFCLSAYILYSFGTHVHFDPWVSPKIYPSFALANGVDLFQQKEGPFILTIYGPGSSLFYLPVSLGTSPKQCIWIAYFMNLTVILSFLYALFFKGIRFKHLSTYTFMAFALLFFLLIEETTKSLFQVHHDIPVLAYLFVGSYFITGKYPVNYNYRILLGTLFIWLACWTKILAVPWLLLPILQLIALGKLNFSSLIKAILPTIGTGLITFTIFSLLFGADDLRFHLFESTNSYPWRICNSLFGDSEEALVANDFLSKVVILCRMMLLYVLEYWWMVMAAAIIALSNFNKKSERILVYLVGCYFLALPTCLSALAKFGGVENSLVFAHTPAIAAIFLQVAKIIERNHFSKHLKLILSLTVLIFFAAGGFRLAKTVLKDPSDSPLQLAYEYLLKNPEDPVYFALSPLPNYLVTGKIGDSGEALTYSTMMKDDALPIDAGMDFLTYTDFVAFGKPPYSRSYFHRKLNLEKVKSPLGLKSWSIYKASPKN